MSESELMQQIDQNVAFIQLRGHPYQRTAQGPNGDEVVDCNVTLNRLAQVTGYIEHISDGVQAVKEHLHELLEGQGYYGIDRKLKHGESLSFDDAFSLGTFVCSALNRPLNNAIASKIRNLAPYETHLLQATALLSAMSAKEGYVGLTADEIAGLVAATLEVDTVVRVNYSKRILAFGGMGGDRGYWLNGARSKLFSLSTLSAIALSTDGAVHKHHSYPNTSKVAGQSAIEAFGARSDFHSQEAFQRLLDETHLFMSSCHDTRTLHTLSHLLRSETINHVIGPLAFTLTRDTPIQGFIGVNGKIHPETIIQALRMLHEKRFQRYDNSAAYCGTDLQAVPPEMLSPETYAHTADARSHVLLDEIAPPPNATLASFLVNGENAGTYALYPEDFYPDAVLSQFSFNDLVIPNEEDKIHYYNSKALSAQDTAKARYLAMTVGLGLFVRYALDQDDALYPKTRRVNQQYLRAYTDRAYSILQQGLAAQKLQEYVDATQKYSGGRV
jgi:anthranilate phosphoribosyltransferase